MQVTFYGSRTRVDVSVGPVNEYVVPGLPGVSPDGIAVEYDAEKPQLGKVAPVTASGEYAAEVLTEVARIAAGTTSPAGTISSEIVNDGSVTQAATQSASVYVIPKALSTTDHPSESSGDPVKSTPTHETLT